jgi:hypothetical protein
MAESAFPAHSYNIGQDPTDEFGFYGVTPVAQQAAVTTVATDVLGTASVTALTTAQVANLNDAVTAINALIDRVKTLGLTA